MSIRLEHVSFNYASRKAKSTPTLQDINLEFKDGEFTAIIGPTGSGKSTLIQHLNCLIRPDEGKIFYNGENILEKNYPLKKLRSRVGLVFQYPEHQLFEDTVFADVAYGPQKMGLGPEEVKKRVRAALAMVGLDDSCHLLHPMRLSGGQKRRAALAGVLAMEPQALVLDEPTVGLDPRGREEILGEIVKLHREKKLTIIMVSHSMEDVARYAERVIVMDHGSIPFDGPPREVFARYRDLEKIGLAAPQVIYIAQALRRRGYDIRPDVLTVTEVKKEILRVLKGGDMKCN
ncbi:energy-coupling factor transporter ATP-binding protein EcfA2 [Spirochaetia bacterium]|nr:energy-coupling factor transporter ATP-binding protein EcfA2 [Spirochaetia bacterium]